ncbi:UDP-N-acetylmuramate--L-alanine ligase [Mycoplasma sp. P36-A1]|uniref:UDP-N-acetylmuramate--L-alanine ligase n=1 Tax=Mycoplasma sp. P36-A1 TaxID=3252900 RepID=UPI003C2E5475
MKHYYFIGIKGSGMASLANILLDLGYEVSGSDIDQHIFLEDRLRARGVEILPFSEDNLKDGMIVIKGNAFDNDFSEVKKAKEMNLEMHTYMEMLQKLINEYYSVSIAGTHGKTTTTGLVSSILSANGSTGYLIGDGHGEITKDSENFVVESCEYKDNFLNYTPDIALINNIELDHVDYFHSMKQYIDSFAQFASQAKKYVVLNGDDKNVLEIPKKDNYYYFGENDNNNFQAKNVVLNQQGIKFDLYTDYKRANKEYVYTFNLNLFGHHMMSNALAAIAIYVLRTDEQDYKKMEEQLNLYKGVARRFDVIEQNTNIFVDDYAHHPTAIKLMIETVKIRYPFKRVISFFKPDRYSRIYQFGDEIAKALDLSDEAYLFEFPSTSAKEEGIDINMNYVLEKMNKGVIIDESKDSVERFKDYRNCIFLFMSSKNVYDFRDQVIAITKH